MSPKSIFTFSKSVCFEGGGNVCVGTSNETANIFTLQFEGSRPKVSIWLLN